MLERQDLVFLLGNVPVIKRSSRSHCELSVNANRDATCVHSAGRLDGNENHSVNNLDVWQLVDKFRERILGRFTHTPRTPSPSLIRVTAGESMFDTVL